MGLRILIGSFFAVVVLLSACSSGSGGRTFNTKGQRIVKILFIGNSYTYRNCGIDCHLNRLIEGTDLEDMAIIKRAAQGKYHLYTHWQDPTTLEILRSEKWDNVILQEYSSGPVREPNQFMKYGKLWRKLLAKINPKVNVLLFSTWGYRDTKNMTDSLDQKYHELEVAIGGKRVPVGLLWKDLRSKINLYDGDGAHPNRKGTFLNACLFYEYLFNRDVTKTKHWDDQIPKNTQVKLKRWAHEFHRKHP